jgi:hypothetical protein
MNVIAVAAAFSGLSIIFVALRLYTRFAVIHRAGKDDYAIVASLVSQMPIAANTQFNPNTLPLQMFAISSFSMLVLGGLGHIPFRPDTHMCAIEVHYGVGKPKTTLSVEHIERQFLVCPTTLEGNASDDTESSKLNYSNE